MPLGVCQKERNPSPAFWRNGANMAFRLALRLPVAPVTGKPLADFLSAFG